MTLVRIEGSWLNPDAVVTLDNADGATVTVEGLVRPNGDGFCSEVTLSNGRVRLFRMVRDELASLLAGPDGLRYPDAARYR